MELDLVRMTVTQALATTREALANYNSSDTIEIRTDNEVVKLNLYNQLNKMGMRCKLERKGPFFILKAQPKGKSSERKAIRRASRSPEREKEEIDFEPVDDPNQIVAPRQEEVAFPVREENHIEKPPPRPEPRPAPQAPRQQAPPRPQPTRHQQAPPPAEPPASYAAVAAQQRQASMQSRQPQQPEPMARPKPQGLFQGEFDETPIEPGQGPWLIFQHDQIGQKDNTLGVELLYQVIDSLAPGAYAGVFLVHRGVRLVDPQYHQAAVLRALLRKPIAVFADETSMAYFKLIGKTSPRVKVVPFALLLELSRTQPVIWF
jgi:hypothetical protein